MKKSRKKVYEDKKINLKAGKSFEQNWKQVSTKNRKKVMK